MIGLRRTNNRNFALPPERTMAGPMNNGIAAAVHGIGCVRTGCGGSGATNSSPGNGGTTRGERLNGIDPDGAAGVVVARGSSTRQRTESPTITVFPGERTIRCTRSPPEMSPFAESSSTISTCSPTNTRAWKRDTIESSMTMSQEGSRPMVFEPVRSTRRRPLPGPWMMLR